MPQMPRLLFPSLSLYKKEHLPSFSTPRTHTLFLLALIIRLFLSPVLSLSFRTALHVSLAGGVHVISDSLSLSLRDFRASQPLLQLPALCVSLHPARLSLQVPQSSADSFACSEPFTLAPHC